MSRARDESNRKNSEAVRPKRSELASDFGLTYRDKRSFYEAMRSKNLGEGQMQLINENNKSHLPRTAYPVLYAVTKNIYSLFKKIWQFYKLEKNINL